MTDHTKIKYWWSADRKWFCVLTDDGMNQSTVSLTAEEAALLAMNATPIPDTSAGERETGSYEYGSLQDRIDDATRDAAESHKEDCNSYGAGYDSGYLAALIEIRDADPPSSAGERMREALELARLDFHNGLDKLDRVIALQGPSGKTGGEG